MKIPAAPVYMILTSDGLLVLYHMVYLAPGIKQITKAVEALSPEGVREAQGNICKRCAQFLTIKLPLVHAFQ